ncbi:MAG: GH3 auxin-responsive promoter family protein [Candidatus Obscuribacterales bacterium]|nr:GH3 auxin-responsive promoter family protein [Candidatus Obscuribacterales bacterium]
MKHFNPYMALGQVYRELTHIKRFKKALKNPRLAQEEKLLEFIKRNEDTEFGRKHRFSEIKNIKDFQRNVPPSTYEDLEPYIERSMAGGEKQLSKEKPLMYATTSGTTGKPKFIPITESHLKDYTHAFHVHNWGLIKDNPAAAHAPGGKYLIFNSNDQEGFTKDGTPYGAVSGLLRRRQSALIQRYFALPQFVSRIKNIESKYYSILRFAMSQKVVAVTSCNPSTLLLLADQLKEHADSLIKDLFDGGMPAAFKPTEVSDEELLPFLGKDKERARKLAKILEAKGHLTIPELWPELSIVSVWKGGPMPFYLSKLPEKFGDLKIRDFGYMASEGRGTIPLSDEGAGGPAALSSHFFEFVPEEDEGKAIKRYLTLDELEAGKRYFIHFTTAAGLYRYNINDLMEVTGFENATPILQFVQKGMGVSSITGEKLTEEQVSTAIQYAIRQHGLNNVDHFILAVQLAETPFYSGFVECSLDLPESVLNAVARTIDQSLQLQNLEYKDKRLSLRLERLTLQNLPLGTFKKLRQKRVIDGAPEAQVKIPFLTNNINFCSDIAKLVNSELALQS